MNNCKVDLFSAFKIWLVLAVCNVVYQAFVANPDWKAATERSFFQAVAVLVAWFIWRKSPEKG